MSSVDRLRLYRIFLRCTVRNSESEKELDDVNYSEVTEVKGILGITDTDESDEFKVTFCAELQKALNLALFEIMSDDFTETLVTNMKENVDKIIKDYRVSADLVAEFAAPIYMRAFINTNVDEKLCNFSLYSLLILDISFF